MNPNIVAMLNADLHIFNCFFQLQSSQLNYSMSGFLSGTYSDHSSFGFNLYTLLYCIHFQNLPSLGCYYSNNSCLNSLQSLHSA